MSDITVSTIRTRLLLFDIDGTLCPPMGILPNSTEALLRELRKQVGVNVGVVGGSDRPKAIRQLGLDVLYNVMDHSFHENGCTYYQYGKLVCQDMLEDYVSPSRLNEFVKYTLKLVSETDSPWLTGTFIERRSCMLNISPVGRACSAQQRKAFFEWDQKTGCRAKLVKKLKQKFSDLPLDYAIGGQISIDVFPRGLNKTHCLHHVIGLYDEIHFFGDQVGKGGNDHEIYADPRVIGHKTSGFEETEVLIGDFIKLLEPEKTIWMYGLSEIKLDE